MMIMFVVLSMFGCFALCVCDSDHFSSAFQISLGDAKSYFLSTARNELGVILAYSTSGFPMHPISWQQMECPVSKTVEFRKVAKPAT